ncbi:phosphatase PAP2 family protein [Sanguibacter sp. 25GB23B1]|uniref:phosphatase PAP2 family protein n=1 Tax=unclassified Sanguibacter TaxID=2645534 RepID=UPI0032AF26D4
MTSGGSSPSPRARVLGFRLPPVLVAVAPGVLLVAAGVGAFLGIFEAVREQDDLALLDQPVLEWLAAHRTGVVTTVLTWVTNTFGPVVLPIVVALCCLVWAWLVRTWRDPALLVGAMVLSTVISVLIKAVVARPRPDDGLMTVPGVETSFSFPSGHTIGAATLVLVSGYLIWSRHHSGRLFGLWALASVVVVAIVAVSRLYLGYHFVTDVLAAVSLALAVLGVVVAAHRWLVLEGVRETVDA